MEEKPDELEQLHHDHVSEGDEELSHIWAYPRMMALMPKFVTSKLMGAAAAKSLGVKSFAMKSAAAKAAASKHTAAQMLDVARPTAYASEVGESFRVLTSKPFVYTMYGLSFGYVFADTFLRSKHVWDEHKQDPERLEKTAVHVLDTAIWHCGASLAFPAITIHKIVDLSTKSLSTESVAKHLHPRMLLFGPVLIGLASIPIIIHPIDHLTDMLLDNTLRRLYGRWLLRKETEH